MRKNSDESAMTPSLKHPQHRADSTDFYHSPEDTELILLQMPNSVRHLLEEAAEHTNRTFNAQLHYAVAVCEGRQLPDSYDLRTVREWQDLVGQIEFRFDEDAPWKSCSLLFNGKTGPSHLA
jgi:hypothetical protein